VKKTADGVSLFPPWAIGFFDRRSVHFSAVEQVERVKNGLDLALQVDLVVTEFVTQPAPFEYSYAVFSGQGASQAQAVHKQFVCGGPDLLGHFGSVEDEVGVQVAVARVRHCRDANAVPGFNIRDCREHRRKLAAGHGDVFNEDRAERRHRGVECTPDSEQAFTVGGVGRQFRVASERTNNRQRGIRFDPRRGTIHLHKQIRTAAGEIQSEVGPDTFQRSGIQQFHGRRAQARGGDDRRRPCRLLNGCEVCANRPHGSRRDGAQFQGGLNDNAECSLRADHQRRQVKAGDTLDGAVAEGEEAAVGEHNLEPQHGLASDAVLRAEQAARVGGDVATNGGDGFARRVGGKPEAVLGKRDVQLVVDDAGLDHGEFVVDVDLEKTVHLQCGEHDLSLATDRTSGEPGARSPGDHGDPVLGGQAHGCLDIDDARCGDNRQRRRRRDFARAVGAGRGKVFRLGRHRFAEFGAQVGHEGFDIDHMTEPSLAGGVRFPLVRRGAFWEPVVMPSADPHFAERFRALSSRDARFDGQFITGVHSTGIYCRPSCPAMTPHERNVRFYRTAAAAHEAGLRACKRCLPDAVPGSPDWNIHDDVASRAMRLITDGVVEREGVTGLARRMGYTPRHITRVLSSELGAGPLALARAHRAQSARTLLVGTALPIADVAFASGFSSIRQFNDTIAAIYQSTPTELRSKGTRAPGTRPDTPAPHGPGPTAVTLRLPARAPFDGAGLLKFFADHAVPGLEEADTLSFARAVRLPHGRAHITVRLDGDTGVTCTAELDELSDVGALVTRVRRLFDLDADSVAIDDALSQDGSLAPLVAAVSGIRLPGSLDAEELLFRTLIGQQVSVAAARTVLGRLTAELGDAGLFPSATHIADHGREVLRGPASRVAAIVGIAEALASGNLRLDVAMPVDEFRASLEAFPGVGPWTSGYLAMRVLGNPDVLLTGDLVIAQSAALRGLPATPKALSTYAERWAPWRSYAGLHLWRARQWVPSTYGQPTPVVPAAR
jgi:AraC family transcriptional regulator of adaptative response / DNA-3-methyladenine glycosylase II